MGIFSKSENKDELILVFHVSSSAVGGALFLAQKSGIPKILFSVSEMIPITEKVDAERFLHTMIQSFQVVVKKIYDARLGAPSKIFCALSSAWCVSQTRMINFKKNTPFVFTEKLADDLIQKEIKIIEEEHLLKYMDTDDLVRAIELKNIQTILNGYETSKPLGQKTKDLEMTVFVSAGGERTLKTIENTIGKYFHLNGIKFFSFALASFTVARDMYFKKESFILLDVDGEVTDIFMVKKNILRESISFPLGRNFLTRGVALGLGCTPDEANSFISLYNDGHAEKSVAKKLSLIMDNLRVEWLEKFQESLFNLSKDISIPSIIYIITDRDFADFFVETIKTEQFSQYSLTDSKFKVVFLSANLMHEIASFRENMVRESFLVTDSVYVNRLLIKP